MTITLSSPHYEMLIRIVRAKRNHHLNRAGKMRYKASTCRLRSVQDASEKVEAMESAQAAEVQGLMDALMSQQKSQS